MTARLKDVAALAGVQPSTVSLVLNGHPKAKSFSAKTVMRIMECAEKTGYTPNGAARALATRKSSNIGFIIPEYAEKQWANPFYAELLNGLDLSCNSRNYNLLVHCGNSENAADFVFPRGITEKNVDGLIISGTASEELEKLVSSMRIPCIRVGFAGSSSDESIPVMGPDMLKGRILAIEYLRRIGHKRILIFGGNGSRSMKAAKILESKILENKDLKDSSILHLFTNSPKCDASSASFLISEYMNMKNEERPTAVITNPQTCLGLIKEMKKYGLACPEDISIISNYDYEAFAFMSPSVTSLRYDNAVIGAFAADRLIEAIEKKEPVNRNDCVFPLSLEIRESCRRIQA